MLSRVGRWSLLVRRMNPEIFQQGASPIAPTDAHVCAPATRPHTHVSARRGRVCVDASCVAPGASCVAPGASCRRVSRLSPPRPHPVPQSYTTWRLRTSACAHVRMGRTATPHGARPRPSQRRVSAWWVSLGMALAPPTAVGIPPGPRPARSRGASRAGAHAPPPGTCDTGLARIVVVWPRARARDCPAALRATARPRAPTIRPNTA